MLTALASISLIGLSSVAASSSLQWLVGSLCLALVGTNVAWLVARGRFAVQVPGSAAAPAVAWLVAALFLFLVPFGAWRAGALSPYFLGLMEIDWLGALGVAGLLSAAIMGLAVAGWLVFRRSLRLDAAALAASAGAPGAGVGSSLLTLSERWMAPLDAILNQWHWAFYRALAIGWLAAGAALPMGLLDRVPLLASSIEKVLAQWHNQPVYWGSWIGLGVIAVEWALNPFARADFGKVGRMEGAMRSVALAIATTALFALGRNFWLCLLCSLVVETVVAAWFPPRN